MQWTNFKHAIQILCLTFLAIGCSSEYDRKVKEGLASQEEYPELIFGLEMGQTQKEFFGRCWERNKEGLVAQGPSNQYVRHVLDANSPVYQPEKSMEMLFYGLFDTANFMRGMRFRISYMGWRP